MIERRASSSGVPRASSDTSPLRLLLASLVTIPIAFATYSGPQVLTFAVPGALCVLALAAASSVISVGLAILLMPAELLHLPVASSVGLSPGEIIALVAAALGAARLLSSPKVTEIAVLHVVFGLFLLVVAAGVLVAVDVGAVVKTIVMWSAFLVVSVIVANLGRDQVATVVKTVGLSGGIAGLIAVAGAGHQQLLQGGALATNRAHGAFEDPNALAFFLVLAFPAALVYGLSGDRPTRPVFLAAASLALAGIVLALSRGAILGTLAAMLALATWAPFRRVVYAAAIVVLGVAALNIHSIVNASQVTVIDQRVRTIARPEQTSGGRFELWRTTPRIVRDHPLVGIGAANFEDVSPLYGVRDASGEPYRHAHDVILTVASEFGLLGLGVFLWFVLCIGIAARAALRVDIGENLPRALPAVAGLVGLAAISVTDYPFGTNAIVFTSMVYVGVITALVGERT